MSTITRRLAAAALVIPLTVTVAASAQASSRDMSKSSGNEVAINWVENGGAAADGTSTWLIGDLSARGSKRMEVYGNVTVITCASGFDYNDYYGGGHGEPAPEDSPCTWVEDRFIWGQNVTVTVDKKLTKATLTGQLEVSSHGEGGNGQPQYPQANVTVTGYGATQTSKFKESYSDSDGGSYSFSGTQTGRAATVTGAIGTMIFDDEPGEISGGFLGTYKNMSKSYTP